MYEVMSFGGRSEECLLPWHFAIFGLGTHCFAFRFCSGQQSNTGRLLKQSTHLPRHLSDKSGRERWPHLRGWLGSAYIGVTKTRVVIQTRNKSSHHRYGGGSPQVVYSICLQVLIEGLQCSISSEPIARTSEACRSRCNVTQPYTDSSNLLPV